MFVSDRYKPNLNLLHNVYTRFAIPNLIKIHSVLSKMKNAEGRRHTTIPLSFILYTERKKSQVNIRLIVLPHTIRLPSVRKLAYDVLVFYEEFRDVLEF